MSSVLNILSMHQSQALQEQLEEDYWKERERKLALRDKYPVLLADLQDTDPNWETWWDRHVDGTPQWRGAEIIQARLKALRADPDLPSKEAACSICTLAPALRACNVCKFHTPIIALNVGFVREIQTENVSG